MNLRMPVAVMQLLYQIVSGLADGGSIEQVAAHSGVPVEEVTEVLRRYRCDPRRLTHAAENLRGQIEDHNLRVRLARYRVSETGARYAHARAGKVPKAERKAARAAYKAAVADLRGLLGIGGAS